MKNVDIENYIANNKERFEDLAGKIWDYAELGSREFKSSAVQYELLKDEGFDVLFPAGSLKTGIIAKYGSGHPIIAFLGEFDALPGLSQKSGCTTHSPVVEGAPGHGCGHNLLGIGALEAACAVKDWMEKNSIKGTVCYYGTPAEELLQGKDIMIAEGYFKDVDIALSWHPEDRSFAVVGTKATTHIDIAYKGISAHAANNPWQGRSALDAAEFMNIGANFLREHIPPTTSIQYSFEDSGEKARNIIPDHAAVNYSVRSDLSKDMHDTMQRVREIAEGAALMAGVELSKYEIGVHADAVRKNETLLRLIEENDRSLAELSLTDEEMKLAASFSTTPDHPLYVAPMYRGRMMASTDFGTVSQLLPAAMFCYATYAYGTALHSWKATGQGKTSYAYKALHKAALIMAMTGLDLFSDTSLIEKARADFADSAE